MRQSSVKGREVENAKSVAPLFPRPKIKILEHESDGVLMAESSASRSPRKKATAKAASRAKTVPPQKAATAGKVVLLSGGNPQIAKADGDAPVQAFISAMPGWKQDVGRRLDDLIARTVPDVRKAVRWNTPFYGIEGQGWFLGFHCLTKYVKVAFLNGSSLSPLPPVESKNSGTRYFHIFEGDELDEAVFASWLRQASKLPGERCF